VYIRRIELRDFELKDFLAPLSKELWITAVIMIFTVAFSLTAIHNFQRHKGHGRYYGFLNSLHHVYSIFCQQGRTESASYLFINFTAPVWDLAAFTVFNPTQWVRSRNRENCRRDPSRWPRGTLYPQKLALTSSTTGGLSVGTVRSRTQTTEFFFKWLI
jgi:hypothetical protein